MLSIEGIRTPVETRGRLAAPPPSSSPTSRLRAVRLHLLLLLSAILLPLRFHAPGSNPNLPLPPYDSPILDAAPHAGRLAAASPVVKPLPRSLLCRRPLHPRFIDPAAARMVSYFEANHYDAFVPNDILVDLVSSQLESETASHLHDILAGNRLLAWSDRISGHCWTARASGPLLNRLCLAKTYNPGRGLCVPHRIPSQSITFNTPILQIASTLHTDFPGNQKDFMGVRTFEGVLIMHIDSETLHDNDASVQSGDDDNFETPPEFMDDQTDAYQYRNQRRTRQSSHHTMLIASEPVANIGLSPNALDVCFSRVIPGHAALALEGGSVLIWDARFGNPTSWRSNEKQQDPSMPDCMRRLSIKFGAHPRTLLVAHATCVETCDLRLPSSVDPSILFDRLQPSEIITGIDTNPSQPFEVALATTQRAMIIDTRYPRLPMLHWGLANSHETQAFVEYLPSLSSPSDFASSFMTWGRHTGEVLMYTQHQAPQQPPVSRGVQKLASFVTHPSVLTPDPVTASAPIASTMHPDWPLQDHNERLIDHDTIAPWPLLIGCQAIATGRDSMTLFHLAADGALFAQAYNTGVGPCSDPKKTESSDSYTRTDDDINAEDNTQFSTKIQELECTVLTDERENLQQAQPSLPHGTLASHKLVDMRPIAKLYNRWVDEEMARDAHDQDSSHTDNIKESLPIPSSSTSTLFTHQKKEQDQNISMPTTITNAYDLFIDNKTPIQLSRRWKQDRSVKHLPPLFPSKSFAEKIPSMVERLKERSRDKFPDATIVQSSASFFPWCLPKSKKLEGDYAAPATNNNTTSNDNDDNKDTNSEAIDSIDALRDVLSRELNCAPIHPSQPDGLILDNDRALDWLARDIWATRDTIIPFPTTFEPDTTGLSGFNDNADSFVDGDDSRLFGDSLMGSQGYGTRSHLDPNMSTVESYGASSLPPTSPGRITDTDWECDGLGYASSAGGSQPFNQDADVSSPKIDTKSELLDWYSVPSPSSPSQRSMVSATSSMRSILHSRTPRDRQPMLMRTPLVPASAMHAQPSQRQNNDDGECANVDNNDANNDEISRIPIPGGAATLIDMWDNPELYYDPQAVLMRVRFSGRRGGSRYVLRRRAPESSAAAPLDNSLAEAALAAAATASATAVATASSMPMSPSAAPGRSKKRVSTIHRTSNAFMSQPPLPSAAITRLAASSSQPALPSATVLNSTSQRRNLVPPISSSLSQPAVSKKRPRAKGF